MANGFYEIDETTFKKMGPTEQNWILFTTFNRYRSTCEGRFNSIEKKQKLEGFGRISASAVFGSIGGYLYQLLKGG